MDQAVGTKGKIHPEFRDKFLQAVNNDLNMPQATAVIQETLKAKISAPDKLATILKFDTVLGLNLNRVSITQTLPLNVMEKVDARKKARKEKNWALSDRLRDEIQAMGYMVQDSKEGMKVIKI
jgi:cysteinyl-tRNA synthetase